MPCIESIFRLSINTRLADYLTSARAHIHVYMYVIVRSCMHVGLLHRNQHNINKESQKKLKNVRCLSIAARQQGKPP